VCLRSLACSTAVAVGEQLVDSRLIKAPYGKTGGSPTDQVPVSSEYYGWRISKRAWPAGTYMFKSYVGFLKEFVEPANATPQVIQSKLKMFQRKRERMLRETNISGKVRRVGGHRCCCFCYVLSPDDGS